MERFKEVIPPLESDVVFYHTYHASFVGRMKMLKNPVSGEVVVIEIQIYEE